MPRISAAEKQLRISQVRMLLAQGADDETLRRSLTPKGQPLLTRRQIRTYKALARKEQASILEEDARNIWFEAVDGFRAIIREAYISLQDGKDSPVTLLRVAMDAWKSIIDSGVKTGFLKAAPVSVEVSHTYENEFRAVLKHISKTHPEDRPAIVSLLQQLDKTPTADESR